MTQYASVGKRASLERASKAEVILATEKGIVRVYVADEWLKSTRDNFPNVRWMKDDEFEATQSSRFGFRGRAASPEITQLYLGKKIPMTQKERVNVSCEVFTKF